VCIASDNHPGIGAIEIYFTVRFLADRPSVQNCPKITNCIIQGYQFGYRLAVSFCRELVAIERGPRDFSKLE
jgi:hypothetical protein